MLKKFTALLVSITLGFTILTPAFVAHAAGTNLIANPSVELSSGTAPTDWTTTKTGTNTTVFNYVATGHTGSRSLQAQMTKRTSGQAEWSFTPIPVTPSTKYTYTDWYQSNVQTSLAVIINHSTGTTTTQTTQTVAASSAWKQATISFTTPSNVTTVQINHYLNRIGQLTTDDFDLEGPAPVTPTITLTQPVNGSTLAGTQALTATATGAVGVQFKVDSVNVGAEDTTAPYSVNWDTSTSVNGAHVVTATARSSSGLTAVATSNISVLNSSAPSVVITSPANNATVSGTTVPITATATDAVGIISVQFKLDGNNLGSLLTTAPYSTNLDTTALTNGNHTVAAVATNTSNLATTSLPITINVQNAVPPVTPPSGGTNLIANPSFETANGTVPASWLSSNWGTNTAAFSYVNTGHTGTHSARVDITSYTNGAANWYYADIPVSAGKAYKYSNWYQSNVDTEVDAEITMNDGTVQYAWLGTVFANTSWTQYTTTFTPPAGAKSIAIYQILAKKGYVVSDDYSLTEYTPVPFNRGLVSVTFDDGWTNQYTNALPILQQNGIKATFYIISGELTDQPDYMTATQVKSLYSAGNEIGSHTVTHPDLTTLSQANLVTEMSQSKTTLQNLIGVPVTDFAYPYGAYNANTLAVGKQYYQSQRTVNGGANTKDNFDITQLKIHEVDSNISQAQVQGWIDEANTQHEWLILVYHEIATTPTDPTDALYTTQPSDLAAEMAYLKNSGVATVTVNGAINEILTQL